jgi:hypothetical protein
MSRLLPNPGRFDLSAQQLPYVTAALSEKKWVLVRFITSELPTHFMFFENVGHP